MRLNDGFCLRENLFEREVGGVNQDGIGCGFEWGIGTRSVAGVAFLELLEDGFGGWDGRETGGKLLKSPIAADAGIGIEEDLDFGIGEDGGADITAFHNDAAGEAEDALLRDHPGTDAGVDRDAGGTGGDIGLANAAGDIGAIEKDAIALTGGLEMDGGVRGEGEERGFVVEVKIVFDGFEGERAVHGTGLEIEQTEATSEVRGEG